MTENTPNPEPTLADTINSLPKHPLEQFRHGKWAEHITAATSQAVVTPITLEELFHAQQNGTTLPIRLVNGYKAEVLGDEYNYEDNEDTSYLMNGQQIGKRAIAVKFTETSTDIEAHVSTLTVKQDFKTNKPDPDNWDVLVYHVDSASIAGNSRHFCHITSTEGRLTWELELH